MRIRISVILAVVLWAFCLGEPAFGKGGDSSKKALVRVTYREMDSRPVQMVVQADGKVELRVELWDPPQRDPDDLSWAFSGLEKDVMRFIATPGVPVAIGKTGYRFVYGGGHPIWRRSQEDLGGHAYACFHFADSGTVAGREIKGRGTEKQVISGIRNMNNPACEDHEKILAAVPHDLLMRIEGALQAGAAAAARKVVDDNPDLGLRVFASRPDRGGSIDYTVLNRDGCLILMRQSSHGY